MPQIISGTGGVTVNGSATLTLSGSNTYTGATISTGNGGIISISSIGNGGVASNIGASTNAASSIVIANNGTLRYTGAAASTDRLFSVGAGSPTPVGILDASGTGAINLTNTGSMGFGGTTGARTFSADRNEHRNQYHCRRHRRQFRCHRADEIRGRHLDAQREQQLHRREHDHRRRFEREHAGQRRQQQQHRSVHECATNLVFNGGTLRYTGAAVSTDRLFSVGTGGGTLDASGTGAANFTNTGSMAFNSQTGARTVTLTGSSNANNALAAAIADNGGATSVTKTGSGSWSLTGANTYTGTTTISAGFLSIGSGGTSGSLGTGGVTGNGTLLVNRSDAVTISNLISGSGGLRQLGAGATTLTANNSYTGTTTVSGGVLSISNLAMAAAIAILARRRPTPQTWR